MGSSQLLIIVLGAIFIGVAIIIGMSTFDAEAKQANIDSIRLELIRMAAGAQKYYRTPASLGGGGNSFDGLDMSSIGYDSFEGEHDNISAVYSLADVQSFEVKLRAVSNIDENEVVELVVSADNMQFTDAVSTDTGNGNDDEDKKADSDEEKNNGNNGNNGNNDKDKKDNPGKHKGHDK